MVSNREIKHALTLSFKFSPNNPIPLAYFILDAWQEKKPFLMHQTLFFPPTKEKYFGGGVLIDPNLELREN